MRGRKKRWDFEREGGGGGAKIGGFKKITIILTDFAQLRGMTGGWKKDSKVTNSIKGKRIGRRGGQVRGVPKPLTPARVWCGKGNGFCNTSCRSTRRRSLPILPTKKTSDWITIRKAYVSAPSERKKEGRLLPPRMKTWLSALDY